MEEKIKDMNVYNMRMAAGIGDKLFFLNLIPKHIHTIVDFGCANGELLKNIPNDWNKIGVDNNPEMRIAAKTNCPNAIYFSSLDEFHCNGAMLNLSSVIHEVYSYLPKEAVEKFWNNMFNSNYEYVAIRDMMVSNETNRHWDMGGVLKAQGHALFEDYRGYYPDTRERDLIHFFLKYRYIENWDREKVENYFPITIEELLNLIPNTYEIVYLNHYCLDWTKNKVIEDFGYEIKDNTHIKILLHKRNPN